jgi:sugar/nucleoside kinase (ribokinase family)
LLPDVITLAPGGMGGNVAAAFARLGGIARFVGTFANDEDGHALHADLERDGVRTDWATWSEPPSHRGLILVDGNGERAIIGSWTALANLERAPGQAPGLTKAIEPESLATRRIPGVTIRPDVFDATVAAFYCPFDYAPAVVSAIPEQLPVYMDFEAVHVHGWPEDDIRRCVERASVIFGNQRSLATLCARLGEPSLNSLSQNTQTIFVETLGADGCAIHHDNHSEAVPGYPVAARDSTGAGDCFAAAFMVAHLHGYSLRNAASFACCAAAQSVTAVGSRPGVPTASEMTDLWSPNWPHSLAVTAS